MGWIDPTDRVNGDVLDANLWNQDVVANTLAIFRHLNPVGTVIPYAGDWGDPNAGYPGLADPDVGAPFHLPCTGGIYETADFPLLSRVLGHTFCNHTGGGDDLSREDGWIAGGEALHPGDPVMSKGVYKWDKASMNWVQITADGFAAPDFRGRSPIGSTSGPDEQNQLPGFGTGPGGDWVGTNPVAPISLGVRKGDWRVGNHRHSATYANGIQTGSGANGVWGTNFASMGEVGYVSSYNGNSGTDHNWHPVTGTNFLVFTGQVVPPGGHKPMSTGLRDGSVHRLHPVTNEHMIHQRLADPNISDDEREMLTAQLNGEPWPPMEVS